MKIVQVYLPEDCMHGLCDCPSAKECKFKRCDNCDNICDDKGKAYDNGKFIPDHEICPDCGGDLRQ